MFGLLFERHARSVYNYCFRRTGDWSLAEELMSSAFLEAWRKPDQVQVSSESWTLLPWLLGVATNLLRNQRRSQRRLTNALARLDPRPRQPDFADDIVGRLTDEQQMRAVLAIVGELPPHELDVLSLNARAGLSYVEIATALEIPLGTVRSRPARARGSLRELLEAGGHEERKATIGQGIS